MTADTSALVEKSVECTPMVTLYHHLDGYIVYQCLCYNLVFLFGSIGYQPYSRLGGYSAIGTISA